MQPASWRHSNEHEAAHSSVDGDGAGQVVRFAPRSPASDVASGASLIVDVESGRARELYALSQGGADLPRTENEGKPASPDSGRLLRVEAKVLRVDRLSNKHSH
jgi:hypothetical protein